MDTKSFKKYFGEIALMYGFEASGGGWLKETSEIILLLGLQKSSYANYFYLNIKIFVHGMFDKIYQKGKKLHLEIGNISLRQPNEYNDLFNLDANIEDEERKLRMKMFFEKFLVPFSEKALTIQGIKDMELTEEVYLTPSVRKELYEKLK